MQDKRNLYVAMITTTIITSSIFGALAGFFAVNNKQAGQFFYDMFPGFINRETTTVNDQKTFNVEENSAVVDAVERANPAVVNVVVTKDLPKLEQFYYNPFGNDDFFNNFFGNDFLVPGTKQNGTEKREVGGGSGFIISKDGLVVTNKHVVLDEQADYSILLNNEHTYTAKVLARDPVNDLAILKIETDEDLPVLELGDSDSIKIGQTAIAIGNALGEFRNTVSVGVISGLARSVMTGGGSFSEELTNLIQTDASINPGNSGGPLLNIAGQVIGINTAVAQGAQGIGFAIPINEVKNSIESVKTNGSIVRPWLGVRFIMLNSDVAKANNLKIEDGALIVRGDTRTDLAVVPGSPADKAGLVENDIILEIDGQKLDSQNSLAKVVAKYKPDDEISLKIWHKGEEKNIRLKLGKFDNSQ